MEKIVQITKQIFKPTEPQWYMENINFSHIWVTESPKEIEKIFEEIKEVFFSKFDTYNKTSDIWS